MIYRSVFIFLLLKIISVIPSEVNGYHHTEFYQNMTIDNNQNRHRNLRHTSDTFRALKEFIKSTKRVEGALIIDELKFRMSTVKSKHKLLHAKEFAASLFGNDTVEHQLIPPSPTYQQDLDVGIFEVKEWPAVFTLNCPDVKPLERPGQYNTNSYLYNG